MQQGEMERSPAGVAAAGFPLVGWTAGGQGRPVIGRFEATKARQQPTTPQGNKVVGGCQSLHWGHTELFIIIIIFIVLTSFHILSHQCLEGHQSPIQEQLKFKT